MLLEKISKYRLVFISGKGGVGKTTLSAAIAKALSNKGKKIALIDLSGDYSLNNFFDTKSKKTHEELSPYLSIFRLDTKDILKEFIDDQFHFRGIYKTFFDNRFVNHFLDATPGFNEFLIMGKIEHLVEHDLTFYDTVIVDCPATGHAIALLEVPQIICEAVHSGPIKKLAGRTLDLITNNDKTGIVSISIPEEMPSTEALTLHDKAGELGIKSLGAILTRVQEKLNLDLSQATPPSQLKETIEYIIEENNKTYKNEQKNVRLLKKTFKNNLSIIPTINEHDPIKLINRIIDL